MTAIAPRVARKKSDERVSTGVQGLDDVLLGGLTPNRLYLLEGMGIATGVSLAGVSKASKGIEKALGRPLPGKVHRAGPAPAGRDR